MKHFLMQATYTAATIVRLYEVVTSTADRAEDLVHKCADDSTEFPSVHPAESVRQINEEVHLGAAIVTRVTDPDTQRLCDAADLLARADAMIADAEAEMELNRNEAFPDSDFIELISDLADHVRANVVAMDPPPAAPRIVTVSPGLILAIDWREEPAACGFLVRMPKGHDYPADYAVTSSPPRGEDGVRKWGAVVLRNGRPGEALCAVRVSGPAACPGTILVNPMSPVDTNMWLAESAWPEMLFDE